MTSKGYLSLAAIAERWCMSPDAALEYLADCPRLKFRRAVRYSLAGVEAIEAERLRNPGALAAPRRSRRTAPAVSERLLELRRHFGRA